MVKPRRIVVADNYYHLYNRFVSGLSLFFNKEIVELFFDIFYKFADKFGIEVYVLYCMPNHFHSIIKISKDNLSEFIQRYSTNFARKINKLLNRKGHVFQGRHKSQLIDTEKYLKNLIYYIFNNATRAGIVDKVEEYKWSNLDDVLLNYKNDEKYKILIEITCKNSKNVSLSFLKWLNSENKDKEVLNDIKTTTNQFLLNNVKKEEVLKKIERRNIEQKSRTRRKMDNKKDLIEYNKILNFVKSEILDSNYILPWRNTRTAIKHIVWYILREEYEYDLKNIAEFSKIYKHQTISKAISQISKNEDKSKIIEEIILKVAKVAT